MGCSRPGRFGRVDVVVDVQNGLPFFTRLVTRRPVVVLVHHVHREQWPVVYPGLMGRVGWWIESRLAPRLYRRCQYVAVSQATRGELVGLGVGADRDRGGAQRHRPGVAAARQDVHPLCTVGRLVPHKQVEHAIEAACGCATSCPDLRLTCRQRLVGGELPEHVATTAPADVVFAGHVGEERKQRVYDRRG